jgi:hypothetical protein
MVSPKSTTFWNAPGIFHQFRLVKLFHSPSIGRRPEKLFEFVSKIAIRLFEWFSPQMIEESSQRSRGNLKWLSNWAMEPVQVRLANSSCNSLFVKQQELTACFSIRRFHWTDGIELHRVLVFMWRNLYSDNHWIWEKGQIDVFDDTFEKGSISWSWELSRLNGISRENLRFSRCILVQTSRTWVRLTFREKNQIVWPSEPMPCVWNVSLSPENAVHWGGRRSVNACPAVMTLWSSSEISAWSFNVSENVRFSLHWA